MHTPSLVKIHWHLLKLSSENEIRIYQGQITLQKNDEICPLKIPNQISTISMHIPSLVKIYWHLFKLSSGDENTDGRTNDRRTDGQTDEHTDSQRDTIIPRYYCLRQRYYIPWFSPKASWFWRRRILSVFTIYRHGSHLVQWCETIWTNWQYPFDRRPNVKSGENCSSDFREEDI